jgi:flagellar biosynthetic protein FlhB
MAEKSDKTEKATSQRRRKARKEGNVARSKEVSNAAILLSSFAFFFLAGFSTFEPIPETMTRIFQNLHSLPLDEQSIHTFLYQMMMRMVSILAPILLVVMAAGIVSNLLQFGFLLNFKNFQPKISRFNPVNGLKRLFSLASVGELVSSVLKIIIIGGIGAAVIRGEMDRIPSLLQMAVIDQLAFISAAALKIMFYVCLALLLLAVLDYAFQRWRYEESLKMSKHEVKEEYKQREGDPQVKARIRRAQTEMTRQRMMTAVPEADVIVTNPTHLAIALQFKAGEMEAPIVVAKGAGYIAEKIKNIAHEAGVPVVEQKPLARALFRTVEIGGSIPADLYKAVAEILAYVYRLKGKV